MILNRDDEIFLSFKESEKVYLVPLRFFEILSSISISEADDRYIYIYIYIYTETIISRESTVTDEETSERLGQKLNQLNTITISV